MDRRGPSLADPDATSPALVPQTAAGLLASMQTPYSELGEAASRQDWQNPAMKSLLIAGFVFLAGVALLQVVPDADLVPTGVRAVLDEIAR
jgi:hypothetical protein